MRHRWRREIGVQAFPGDEVQPDGVNSMTSTGVDRAYLEIASPSAASEMQVDYTWRLFVDWDVGFTLSSQCPC